MKNILAVVVFMGLMSCYSLGQTQPERRVIEVSGSAERMITPDGFTFKITLNERIENKQKITIEQQETALRDELTRLGVDAVKDLSIYDITSIYFRQKKIKDVLGVKDYRLKIRDLNKIAQLQDLADRLNVGRLDLIDTEHSDITRLRKETKIEAMKAAKAKAEYLLASIGQTVGKAVFIQETDESPLNARVNTGFSAISNSVVGLTSGVIGRASAPDGLSFTQIKLRYVILARFEIE